MKKLTSYSQNFIHSFIIICGIIGVIGGLLRSLEFPNESNYCLIILIVISLFFYYLYNNKNKKIGIIVLVSEILLCIYLFVLRSNEMNTLIRQLEYIANYDFYLRVDDLFKNSVISDGVFLYALIGFIALPFVYLIISVLVKKKFVFIKIFILMFAFIFPLIIKHPLIDISGYAFTIFLIYSFIFSFMIKRKENSVVHQTIILCIIIPTLLFSNVFLEGNPIFKSNSLDVIFKISSWIEENQWNQWFNTQNSTGASASINGALPNGDVTIDGRVALKIKATKKFSSYIRGYSLGYYTNNRWQPVREEFKGDRPSVLLDYNMTMPSNSEYLTTVEIESTKNTNYQFVPYYPIFNDKLIDDSYFKKTNQPIDVNFSKYDPFVFFENYGDNNDYYNYVLKEYMNVPDNLKDKFKQSIDIGLSWGDWDIGNGSVNEKIKFVQMFLNEYTIYDLEAGNLPAGKDFVEYFLFENQKGSCTHYASAATLLLRYLGVPARYVSGFVMTSNDFDKNNEAIIRNNRAHAWSEVYVKGIGWIVCDFTKDSGYTNSDTTETSMANYLDEILGRQNNQTILPEKPQPKPRDPLAIQPFEQAESNTDTDTTETEVPWYEPFVQYSEYLYVVGGGCLLLIVYHKGKKAYFKLKVNKVENNKKVIYIYQRMLLLDKDKCLINQDCIDIVYKAKFSQHIIDINEVDMFEKELEALQKTVYQTLPWYKKILYKYILGYI